MSKNFSVSWLIMSILLIIVGVVAIVNPGASFFGAATFITWIIAIVLFVDAVLTIGMYVMMKRAGMSFVWLIFDAILLVALGILLITCGAQLMTIAAYVLAVCLIVFGALRAFEAIKSKKEGYYFGGTFIGGLILAVLGLVLIINPSWIMILIGAFLIIYGIISCYTWYTFGRTLR